MVQLYTDIVFILGAILNAMLFVPQALLLYRTKKTNNISLPMFLGFNFIQISTALHGYILEDYILMWGYIFSFFTCGCVTILILIYKNGD